MVMRHLIGIGTHSGVRVISMGHSLGLLVKRPIACPCPCFVGVQCHIYICLTVSLSTSPLSHLCHCTPTRKGRALCLFKTAQQARTHQNVPDKDGAQEHIKMRQRGRAHQDVTERQQRKMHKQRQRVAGIRCWRRETQAAEQTASETAEQMACANRHRDAPGGRCKACSVHTPPISCSTTPSPKSPTEPTPALQ